MKQYIAVLGIIVSSCSSNSAFTPVEHHPFPSSIKKVTIALRGIPMHYTWRHYESSNRIPPACPQYDKSGEDDALLTADLSYSYLPSGAKVLSDTLSTYELTLVVDTVNGLLTSFQLHDGLGPLIPVCTPAVDSRYSFNFQQVPYHPDSLGETSITLSGTAIQKLLRTMGVYTAGSAGGGYCNETCERKDNFTGPLSDTASMIVHLIP
jgi:hypothetical protein